MADIPVVNSLLVDAFAPYVARLGHVSDPDHWFKHLPEMIGAQSVLIVERGQIPVAALTLRRLHPILTLDQIAVAPDLQKSGLGQNIMMQLEQTASEAGYSCISLHTAKIMTHLVQFYCKLGYRITRHGPAPHGLDHYERVFFEKALAPQQS